MGSRPASTRATPAKSRSRVTPEDVEAIRRMFVVVDAIEAHIGDPPRRSFPCRGVVPCPNCHGRVSYVSLTPIKGAARCSGTCGVDYAPLYRIDV